MNYSQNSSFVTELISQVADNSNTENIMPDSRTQLSSSMPLSISLIDSTLAKLLSMKRERSDGMLGSNKKLKVSDTNQNRAPVPASCLKMEIRHPAPFLKIISSPVIANTTPKFVHADKNMCPTTFIQTMIIESTDNDEIPKSAKPLHASEFLTPTKEQIMAYNNGVITAVRTSDVEALRQSYAGGQNLRCCNRFGESLLHVACRRASADVVAFLLNEANVSPCLRDDFGRTPLHDACWRGSPEYDIFELLLSKEPRLAFVADVRGHKPFQYVRKEHWADWKNFLSCKRGLILPKESSYELFSP